MEIRAILPIIQIVLAVLITAFVLLQHTDSGAGSAFGGGDASGNWKTRRGFDKFLFIGTIVLAVLFVISAILALKIR